MININRNFKKEITETNFLETLSNKEKKEIHRDLIRRQISQTKNCGINDISFSNKHTKEIDDIVFFRNTSRNLEYKTDYRALKTGNLALELITYIDVNSFPSDIHTSRFSVKNKEFAILIELIEKIKRKQINTAKLSRHLIEDSFPYVFSYAISNKKSEDTNNIKDIAIHFLFNGKILSNYVQNNYLKGDIAVTKTKNDKTNALWYTVMWLVKIHDIDGLVDGKHIVKNILTIP